MSTSSLGKSFGSCGRAGFLLLASVAALSCEEQKSSGLAVVVESDLQLPKDIDSIRLEVTQNGSSVRMEEHVLGPMGLLLPAEFRLAPTGSSGPVSIRVVGLKGQQPRIERGAITPIPSTYVAMLRMPINFLCAGTARLDGSSTCGDMNTCKQGTCGSSLIGSAELPAYQRGPWTDAESGMRDAAANDCFDVLTCLAGSFKPELDRQTCSFTLDEDDPGRISVAIKLPQGSDGICGPGSCWIALDEGPEGWTQNGLTFTLPPSLCADRSDGTRFTIVVSNTCAGKTLNTPPCGDWSSATHPAEIEEPPGTTTPPDSVETPGEPVGTACAGPSLQACGDCGTQRRTCRNGTWGEWGECTSQGVCAPNAAESCGADGTRACENTCEWGECTGQACEGMTVEACGNCGTRRRACSNGAWSEWGPCLEQGECAPGTTQACGADGAQGCMGNCRWGVCGSQICPGAPSQACGNCGTQTRSCAAATATWSGFGICEQEGVCEANTTRACGTRGMQTCGGNCQWDVACTGQLCEGPATQVCGNCGIQTRSCDTNTGVWSEWSVCMREGACTPGTIQNCGAAGTQACLDTCQWSLECSGQACTGEMTQSCQRCGTQSRVCDGNNGRWLAWGACLNQGPCNPGSTRRCGAGGTQRCSAECTWGEECTGQACEGPSSQDCGDCGTQTRTCDGATGQWSEWSNCSGQGPCTPGETEGCGANRTHTCADTCQFGTCGCVSGFMACGNACVDLQVDPLHCGKCNMSCNGRACAGGTCEACESGTHNCSGQCLKNSELNSCGDRCEPCPVPANATATCNGTQCEFQCKDGFHLCNGQCVDNRDVNNCGGRCGNPCPAPAGGMATCNGTVCGSTCPAGTHTCNNQCVSNNEPATCGTRCTPCPVPEGGSVACTGGQCVPSCPSGRHLCGNACVSNTDPATCGSLCTPCEAPAGGGAACMGGECVPTCPNGQHRCGNTCVSNNDVRTCGNRCEPCPAGPTGSQATCDGATCNSTCPAGTRQCTNPSGCFANDQAHCGVSCVACVGGQQCNGNDCVCPGGTHFCDRQCVSSKLPSSCGDRCEPCPVPKGGTANCNGTVCIPNCPDGTHLCNNECVSNDAPATCGSRCTPCEAPVGGSATCTGGECVAMCPNGQHLCGNTCVSNNDVNSCGDRCQPCPSGPTGSQPTCTNGVCNNTCPGGAHLCGDRCVSSRTIESCGDRCEPCPVPKGGNATCDGTTCGLNCPAGMHLCNNECVSNTAPGTCGSRCTPCEAPVGGSATCEGGECVPACPNGQHLCGNTCVSNNDVNSCGDRCQPCPSGPTGSQPTCTNGVCNNSCAGNTRQCTNPSGCFPNDDAHCGASCAACTGGRTCNGTACVCGSSQVECPTGCVPNDVRNCGDCGIACLPGQLCVAGDCVSRQLDGGPIPE